MDIFDNPILCKDCKKETVKTITIKNNFKLRSINCKSCNKTWYHPTDLENYKEFQKIKIKPFKVKLRFVGNSYTVSIHREIIEFEDLERQLDKFIEMSLEEPGKLSLFFQKIRKVY